MEELASREKNGIWTKNQTPIHKDKWVKVPNGTSIARGYNGVYILRKELYRSKQAPRKLNFYVDKFLKD